MGGKRERDEGGAADKAAKQPRGSDSRDARGDSLLAPEHTTFSS